MIMDFLDTENSRFSLSCFITALIILLVGTAVYFIRNHGCDTYSQHLSDCIPYKCTERVMGFESKYMGHTAVTISREITGLEKDQFFNTSTCNTTEIDNTAKDEQTHCKYSYNTRILAASRAAIQFGTDKLPQDPANAKLSSMELAEKRATYIARSPEQLRECVTAPVVSQK